MYKSISILLSIVFLTSCMKWESPEIEPSISVDGEGIYILNEGNFQYGNATLSYYNPVDKTVENEVFYRSNGMKLGDVAQSMNIFDDKGWIVVNNSRPAHKQLFKRKQRLNGKTLVVTVDVVVAEYHRKHIHLVLAEISSGVGVNQLKLLCRNA